MGAIWGAIENGAPDGNTRGESNSRVPLAHPVLPCAHITCYVDYKDLIKYTERIKTKKDIYQDSNTPKIPVHRGKFCFGWHLCWLAGCPLIPLKRKQKALHLSVNVFSTKVLIIIGDNILRFLLETGPPFYEVIWVTRRSSCLQGKGSTLISQLF